MKLKNIAEKKVPVTDWRNKIDGERLQQIKDFLLEREGIEEIDALDVIANVSLEDSETQNSLTVFIMKRTDEIQIANSPTYIETLKYNYTLGENGRKNYKILGRSIDIINSESEARVYTLSLGYNSKFKKDMENMIVTNDFTKENIIKKLEEMIQDNDKYDTGIFESTGVMLMWDEFCHFAA